MGLFTNEEEEREKRRAEEAHERRARNERAEAEAKLRKAEIEAAREATRDRAYEQAEREEGRSEIRAAQQLALENKGDTIIELIRRYESFQNSEISGNPIRQLILSYNPPTDRDGIRLFFQTLFVNEDYIKTFINANVPESDPSRSKFYQFWENLNKKGNTAWDEAFRDYVHEMSDEEKAALEDIRQLKKATGVEVLKKMMIYYHRFSDPMPHGSRRGKDMSPAAQEALTYIINHDAPTETNALEEYTDYVLNNQDDFDTLQMRHGLLLDTFSYDKFVYTDIGRNFKNGRHTLHEAVLRKVDKAIKDGGHKMVTSGAIGQRNANNRQTRKVHIGCAIAAVISILLFVLAVATCE